MRGDPLSASASCIYEGAVRHRRFELRGHEFRHRLALAYVDLEELPRLLNGRLVRRRAGLVRFRRRDYLGDPSRPLAESVRDVVQARAGVRPAGPIRLLTNLRTCGRCFHPVSVYYCFGMAGDHVEHVVAEVTNTPWGERHAYVLSTGEDVGGTLVGGSPKLLRVSPFMAMDHHYAWLLSAPGRVLSVHIESRRAGSVAFDATLSLPRRKLTRASLARITARYPFASLRVLALIYAHALRLKLEGVPVHPHPQAGAG